MQATTRGPFDRDIWIGATASGRLRPFDRHLGGGSNPSLEMDHGARQGAGDSLDGLDFGNDKLPESINVCALHAHNDVVRAPGVRPNSAATCVCFAIRFGWERKLLPRLLPKAHPGPNRSPADDTTAGKKPQPGAQTADAACTREYVPQAGPAHSRPLITTLKNDRIALSHPLDNRH